jgi:hypothetical protein
MSERETLSGDSIQRWKGVNQRTSPTIVQDGFFSHSMGVYFNNEGVVRIFGKRLAGKLGGPIFHIFQIEGIALLQTQTALWSVTVAELSEFFITQFPEEPEAPLVYNILHTTLTVQAPPSYPAHTTSFSVQMRYIEVARTGAYADVPHTWTDLDVSNPDPSEIYNLTGLWEGGIYEFRCAATNAYGTTYSEVARVQLSWLEPVNAFPVYQNIALDDFEIVVPAIPSVTEFEILWLTGADRENIADYTPVVGYCEWNIPVILYGSDLISPSVPAPGTTYTFRYRYTLKQANNTFVEIVTDWSEVLTAAPPATVRITTLSDTRVTSTGDRRITS